MDIAKEEYIKKSNASSWVWSYFSFKKTTFTNESFIVDYKTVYCRIGDCKWKNNFASQTTNMINHVKKSHEEEYAKHTEKKEKVTSQKISTFLESQQPYPAHSSKAQLITDKITNLLIEELLPFSVVNSTAFREVLQSADPRYNVPDRNSFATKYIPKLYEEKRDKLKALLKYTSQSGEVIYPNITHDCWTSIATQSYATMTVHFIHPDTLELHAFFCAPRKWIRRTPR